MKRKSINNAIERLLRPVVRLCLRHSIKLPELLEILKVSFVNIAEEELARGQEPISMSKVSVMTGVHRKDLARFKKKGVTPRQPIDLITKILGLWQSDERFCSSSGRPKVLDYQGKTSEFNQLVTSVSRDLNSYTVLSELERTGAVKKTKVGLKLVAKMYNPSKDATKSLLLLADDIDDLSSAVEQNIFEQPEIPNLHIRTDYDNIPEDKLEEIKQWFIKEGSSFHKKARNYLSKLDRDTNKSVKNRGATIRASLGTFSRIEVG